MKRLYLHSAACISPQTSDSPVREFTQSTRDFTCIEPDYKTRIDAKMIRRMSRIIRMGFFTALESMETAGQVRPGAIISATGLGCLEDTGVFIEKMISNKEEMLSPTAFIQSTHNAVAAQIALSMQNHGYNHTWVQGGISFENALADAALYAAEHSEEAILLIAADEVTNYSRKVLGRFGLSSGDNNDGIPTGEGAVSMIVSAEQRNSTVCISACETLYAPGDDEKVLEALGRWTDNHLRHGEEVILLSGRMHPKHDAFFDRATGRYFGQASTLDFKHYCGEYPVVTSFAVWMGRKMLLQEETSAGTVVILNRDPRGYCSFILLHRC